LPNWSCQKIRLLPFRAARVTLDPRIDQGLTINQNLNKNSVAPQQNLTWLQDNDPGQNSGQTQGLPINQNGGSNKSPQQST
jgi:hypothetical protein